MQDKITLISVSGQEQFLASTIKAAEYSNRKHRFKTKVVSNVPFSHEYIEYVPTESLDYQGYSDFCIEKMVDYIDTEFMLIFQNDGFILDSDLWKDEFFNYDYVGAPWPHWIHEKYKINENSDVGNGGFCLRSKRLMKKVQEIIDPRVDHRPLEDALIARRFRPELEKLGFKWPKAELAAKFSVEHPTFDNDFNKQEDINRIETFGFHAKGKQSCYLNLLK